MREADVALETEAYKTWKASGKATRETCPLHIKVFERVRMVEKSSYERLAKALSQIRTNVGFWVMDPDPESRDGWKYLKAIQASLAELDSQEVSSDE